MSRRYTPWTTVPHCRPPLPGPQVARVATLLILIPMLVGSTASPGVVSAQTPATPAPAAVPAMCVTGTLPHAALSMFCVPSSGWNGDLVVWAPGYVDVTRPIAFHDLDFPGDVYLPTVVQSLGYAFATTSYRQNGLAILEGVDDVRNLVDAFPSTMGVIPKRTYLTGASAGGAVTTLLIERHPELFSGGLAACGPIGSFKAEIDYVGDFRVLFDYFFPDIIPGSPTSIPDFVINQWESKYRLDVRSAVNASPGKADELLRTSRAAFDPTNPPTKLHTVEQLLWYSVFATNDANVKLSGQPYSNRDRWYSGSDDDLKLNRLVKRFTADPATLPRLANYQPSGRLTRPLVTLHTIGDEMVPFWHEILFQLMAKPVGGGKLTVVPSWAYGHCNFSLLDMIISVGVLVSQVTGSQPSTIPQLDLEQANRDFAHAQRWFKGRIPRD